MNRRQEIDFNYYGYTDEDTTARYHDERDVCMEAPVGDLFDDDTYWKGEDGSDEEE